MLGQAEYRRLSAVLEPFDLVQGEALHAPGESVTHFYFPEDAVVSLLFDVDRRRRVEVAMEGNEGAVGVAAYLGGVSSPNLCVVRDAGHAMRLEARVLTEVVSERDRLPGLLRRYVHALVVQVAQSGICNRFHNIDARLARWLLMTHDRVGSPELLATQESIAQMLGVRRSSVTAAAVDLHRRNLISYARGRIEIRDTAALRLAACPCYSIIRREYDAFLD